MWKKYYGDGVYSNNMGIENTCSKANDGYIISGNSSIFGENFQTSVMIYRFNSQFDTLWTRKYLTDTISLAPYATVYCSGGGYAIAGTTKRDAETGEILDKPKALLLRTDSDGNYLWHKTYGTTEYDDTFYKIVQTPDGGFLCGGATQSYGSHTWDWYLVKTDANGNEEWHRTYGSTNYDDGRIMGITLTSDTSYIITGSKTISSTEDRPHLIKLNENFVLEIDKILPFPASSSLTAQVKEIENNQFIAIGSDRMNTNECTQTTLTKFNSELDIIWRQKYTVGDTTYTENYLFSVDTCSDGGYILGGWAAHNGQKLALIKTDSLGCDGTDWWECSTGVMVNEFASNPEFYMYPNPAKQILTIIIPSFEGIQNTTVQIYNLTGKLVKSFPFGETEKGLKIETTDLQKGVYIVKVGEQMQKLVVE